MVSSPKLITRIRGQPRTVLLFMPVWLSLNCRERCNQASVTENFGNSVAIGLGASLDTRYRLRNNR